jgi:hypothetical protein
MVPILTRHLRVHALQKSGYLSMVWKLRSVDWKIGTTFSYSPGTDTSKRENISSPTLTKDNAVRIVSGAVSMVTHDDSKIP